MAELIEVNGIVLASAPSGDYDKRVLLLTKELGKVTAFAKGARRPGNHLMAVSNTFAFGKFTLYPGRSAYTVERAEIKNYFRELTTNLDAAYYGYYFLELAEYFATENADESENLKLVYYALKALLDERIPNKLVRAVYELKQLVINGEYPDMFTCAECGTKENIAAFSMIHNGVLCENCRSLKGAMPINSTTVYALQYTVVTDSAKLFSFTVSEESLGELRRVLSMCMSAYVDKKMKSLAILEAIED